MELTTAPRLTAGPQPVGAEALARVAIQRSNARWLNPELGEPGTFPGRSDMKMSVSPSLEMVGAASMKGVFTAGPKLTACPQRFLEFARVQTHKSPFPNPSARRAPHQNQSVKNKDRLSAEIAGNVSLCVVLISVRFTGSPQGLSRDARVATHKSWSPLTLLSETGRSKSEP